MLPTVKTVKPLSGFKLLVEFEGGDARVFDVTPLLQKAAFKEIVEKGLFSQVRVSFDSVAWPNGADIDPEILYQDGEKIA